MKIYEEGVMYKFRTSENEFYTGKVVLESDTHIKVQTTRDELVILLKNSLQTARPLQRTEQGFETHEGKNNGNKIISSKD